MNENVIRIALTENELESVNHTHQLMQLDIPEELRRFYTYDLYNRFKMFILPESPFLVEVHDTPVHPSFPDVTFLEIAREHVAQPLMFLLNNGDETSRYVHRGYSLYLNILRTTSIPQSIYDDLSQWGAYLQLCNRTVFAKRLPHRMKYWDLLEPHVMNRNLLTLNIISVLAFAMKSVRDSMEFPLRRGRLILSETHQVIW